MSENKKFLPGLNALVEEEKLSERKKAASASRKKANAEKRTEKEQSVREKQLEFLKNSPVAELLEEAAKLLRKMGHKDAIVTLFGDEKDQAVELSLIWDYSSNESRSSGGHYSLEDVTTHSSWEEVRVGLVTDKSGNIQGYIFNEDLEDRSLAIKIITVGKGKLDNIQKEVLAETVDQLTTTESVRRYGSSTRTIDYS